MAAAFLGHGPATLDYLAEHTQFRTVGSLSGDYLTHLPDSRAGRLMYPDTAHIDGLLKKHEPSQPLLSLVYPEANMWNGAIPYDANAFSGGRAVAGALLLACLERQVPVLTQTPGRRLIVDGGRVIGVQVERDGRDFFVRAQRGVLLNTGGFEWNAAMNQRFLPGPSAAILPCSVPSNEGDGHRMGMAVGADLALMDLGILSYGIVTPDEPNWGLAEGLRTPRPLPGSGGIGGQILVNRHGHRCCDETFYPGTAFAAMAYPTTHQGGFQNSPMYWIADQAFRDNNPLGPLPRGSEMRPWILRADSPKRVA
jgi:3-oxosteroid 1-dehydrogenase